jgi:hypothetical protein
MALAFLGSWYDKFVILILACSAIDRSVNSIFHPKINPKKVHNQTVQIGF